MRERGTRGVPNDASSEGVRMPDQSEGASDRVGGGFNSKTIGPRGGLI